MSKSAGLAMLPWYPGDFMTATRGWSVTARGVYRELLDAQWDMGALPADPEELRMLINATANEWRIGWAKCEGKFPPSGPGQRRNDRLEIHRSNAEKLKQGQRNGAATTNAKRAAQRAQTGSDSERSPDQTALGSTPLGSISISISDSKPSPISHPLPLPRREGRVGGIGKVSEKRIPTADELEALEQAQAATHG